MADSATLHSLEDLLNGTSSSSSASDSDLDQEGPALEFDASDEDSSGGSDSGDDDRVLNDAVRHQKVREQSYALLEDARKNALRKRNYDSASTRDLMTAECVKRTGLTPYPEQLDLAECMLLGLDATCIAPTGWGKTLPFVLPLFACPNKIILIISPLNALETDQAHRFQKMGVSAVALNSITYTAELEQAVRLGKFSIILVGPKMCVDPGARFRAVLSDADFGKKVLGLHVDEAQCIAQWGGDFRPEYSALEVVRALLTFRTSVQVMSATMSPPVLKLARDTMHIGSTTSFHVNLGNDRHNIYWEVHYMNAGATDLDALGFLLPPEDTDLAHVHRLPETMIFFDDIILSMKARLWFLEQLPISLHSRVKCYNARRSEYAKKLVMEDFENGHIDMLFTTEAAGMGCDLRRVENTVQFMAPDSLSTMFQRAGRAGRDPDMNARFVLLIQPSVFQEVGKDERKEGEEVTYKKEIEDGLRMWAGAPINVCRRDVADKYFDNPPGRKPPTGKCCDNCVFWAARAVNSLKRSLAEDMPSSPRPRLPDMPDHGPDNDEDELVQGMSSDDNPGSEIDVDEGEDNQEGVLDADAHEESPNDPLAPENWLAYVPKTRRGDVLQEAKTRMRSWRQRTWKSDHHYQPYGDDVLLPEKVLTQLATQTRYRTVDDLSGIKWMFRDRYGRDVLDVLAGLDREVAEEKMQTKRATRDAAIARRQAAAEKREQARILRQAEAAKRREEVELRKREQAEVKELKKQAQAARKAAYKAVRKDEAERKKAAKKVEALREKEWQQAEREEVAARKQKEGITAQLRGSKRKTRAAAKDVDSKLVDEDEGPPLKRLRADDEKENEHLEVARSSAGSCGSTHAPTSSATMLLAPARPRPTRPLPRPLRRAQSTSQTLSLEPDMCSEPSMTHTLAPTRQIHTPVSASLAQSPVNEDHSHLLLTPPIPLPHYNMAHAVALPSNYHSAPTFNMTPYAGSSRLSGMFSAPAGPSSEAHLWYRPPNFTHDDTSNPFQ